MKQLERKILQLVTSITKIVKKILHEVQIKEKPIPAIH
jgi:hypothetical protein